MMSIGWAISFGNFKIALPAKHLFAPAATKAAARELRSVGNLILVNRSASP